MPQATDLVIKNAANVDKTFTLITPAAGDGGVAQWALKEGAISGVFPQLTASAHRNVGQKSRNLKTKFVHPSGWVDASTGLTSVGSRAEFNSSVTIPDDFPEDKKADFVAFATLSFRTALLQAMIRDAVPAT